MSSQKCGVGNIISEISRQSRTPRWRCKIRLWSSCSVHWTGLVCVSNDRSKSNVIARLPDCDGHAADAVSAYTQVEMEDASRLLRIPKSECPDIWIDQHWRSSGSSRSTFVRAPTCWSLVGKTVRRTWMEKKYRMETVFLFIENKDCSCRYTWMTSKWWKEAEYKSYVEEIDETGRSWRTNIISWPRAFGKWNHFWEAQKKVPITNFCWSNWQSTRVGKTSRKDGCVVLRYGRRCAKMRWRVLRTGEQNDRTVIQSQKSLHGWSPVKQEEHESVGELPQVCSQIVLKCLYVARIGMLGILRSVKKLARSVTEWKGVCDRRLARLFFKHSPRRWLPTILSWGTHGSALSIGFVPRLRFCWRLWGLKISLGEGGGRRGSYVFFWCRTFVSISWMCKK